VRGSASPFRTLDEPSSRCDSSDSTEYVLLSCVREAFRYSPATASDVRCVFNQTSSASPCLQIVLGVSFERVSEEYRGPILLFLAAPKFLTHNSGDPGNHSRPKHPTFWTPSSIKKAPFLVEAKLDDFEATVLQERDAKLRMLCFQWSVNGIAGCLAHFHARSLIILISSKHVTLGERGRGGCCHGELDAISAATAEKKTKKVKR
jgi:hypothetical protein